MAIWWTSKTSPARWISACASTVLSHAVAPALSASNVFASLSRGHRSTVCSCGAPSERKRSRSTRVAITTAAPAFAPAGAHPTCRVFQPVSQLGAAPSKPTTASSGVGPKSQSHAAASARHSGSARGRQAASAAGSSSTNRSYATWLTCIGHVVTVRCGTGKRRPRVSTRVLAGVSGGAAQPRVERIAERVAEEVEGKDREKDGRAGAQAHPPHQVREVARVVIDVLAPRRIRWLSAEAEEAKRRLRQDRSRRAQRRLHDERVRDVRKDVPCHDAKRRRPDRPRRDHELALAHGEYLPACEARVRGDRDDADRDHRVLDLRSEGGRDRDREDERREREQRVDEPHRE